MSQSLIHPRIQDAGVGLRSQHYASILANLPSVPWFEVLSDNYLDDYGPPLQKLEVIRQHYPVVMHGVGLSIGSSDPLNKDYLNRIKALAERIDPAWISDHICWTSHNHRYSHELLPLPYTEAVINHIVARIQTVQDCLKRPLLLENISSYLRFNLSEMSEPEFINSIATRSGCGILLDINNIYVNSHNHGFKAEDYVQAIQVKAVKQFHLAGYEKTAHLLVDTHGAAIFPEVWQLYQLALNRFGPIPTCIEWDNHVPDWGSLLAETHKAQAMLDAIVKAEALCN
ncbi:MAG: DUF692 domain-containing protein [Gammaproteobacteria bacterium]|nr:DUF692 domain-containing protein [Gammaproteobacteria bacterium]